jgi:hypothetical protein
MLEIIDFLIGLLAVYFAVQIWAGGRSMTARTILGGWLLYLIGAYFF